jgi:hypothetical protein
MLIYWIETQIPLKEKKRLFLASNEVGIKVNAQKANCNFMWRHYNAGQNHSMKTE